MSLDREIRKTLGIKGGDSLPFKSWSHSTRREDLVQLFAKFGYLTGAEIGVAEGRFSRFLCQTIPGLKLLCVDPWMAYDRCTQELCDARYSRALVHLQKYNATIIRKTSLDAAREIPDESLDFVYIDGDHRFDYVMQDIIEWSKKVRKAGIVSGHDFYHFYKAGVIPAVEAYVRAHNISNWYITWEKEASWFFLKT
jgi:hypothetical protein